MALLTSPTVLPWSTVVTYDHTKVQPLYKDLPENFNLKSAWEHWGKGDQLGTVNRLTPEVVKAAARLVQDGVSVSLNLPVQMPAKPSFHRREPVVELIAKYGTHIPVRDETLHMNDQSGTQWDGLRHFGVMEGNCFYQGVPGTEVLAGAIDATDPLAIDPARLTLGIHHWAAKGITGRGVFLDMVAYYERDGVPLHYDPCTTHVVSLVDMKACAEYQGTTFLPGDILVMRMGWTVRYYNSTKAEKDSWGIGGQEKFAGVENTEEIKAWIWDNQFSAVASDMPSFESWPAVAGKPHLHQTVIANFGCPIGEFFDCEILSRVCKEKKRYTFFFVSNPLNILGGCASTANASAIF